LVEDISGVYGGSLEQIRQMGVRHKINAKCAFEKIEHEKDECSQKQDCDEQEKQANDGQTN
jgi:hypothetical protein